MPARLIKPVQPLEQKIRERGRCRTVQEVEQVVSRYGEGAIPLLMATLRRSNSPTREAAASALRALGEPGFFALLHAAGEGHGEACVAAVICLGDWRDPRAVPALIKALEHEKRDRFLTHLGTLALYALVILILVTIVIALAALARGEGLGSAGSFSGFNFALPNDTRLRVEAVTALAKIGDINAIAPLARLARDRDRFVSRSAQQALMQLLPAAAQLHETEAEALGQQGIPAVAELLDTQMPALIHATLPVLHAVGDARALPAVKRLLDRKRLSPVLHREAIDVLTLLHERQQREQARMTLLRGSKAPSAAAPSAELLRAAQPTVPNGAPEQLLRAANTDTTLWRPPS